MAISLGSHAQKSEINVTPMIDVLLVLIIIYLVITPIQSRGLAALVPQPATETTPDPPAHDIVITVLADGQVNLNQEVMDLPRLERRLADLFKTRAVRVVFLRGDKGLEFREVARVMDAAKGAGAGPIGLMTR
jgi:biopolymer transport protein ExbD